MFGVSGFAAGLHVKDCQGGFYRELREAHDRTTARWPAAPWMLTRAFAKHVKGLHVFRFSASAARQPAALPLNHGASRR